MLCVFAFSITPTIILHNWLADHTDAVKKTSTGGQDHVGKKLYNCHCDNIVAESPFTESNSFVFSPQRPVFVVTKTGNTVSLSTSEPLSRSLRGPPAV